MCIRDSIRSYSCISFWLFPEFRSHLLQGSSLCQVLFQKRTLRQWNFVTINNTCFEQADILQTINLRFWYITHYVGPTRLLAATSTLSESLICRTAVKFTYKRAMTLWIRIAVSLVYATFSLLWAARICIVVPSRRIALRISRGFAWMLSIISSCRTLALKFQYNI